MLVKSFEETSMLPMYHRFLDLAEEMYTKGEENNTSEKQVGLPTLAAPDTKDMPHASSGGDSGSNETPRQCDDQITREFLP